MLTSIKSDIILRGLIFEVNLGWPEAERKQLQSISVDIRVRFPEPPIAGITDNLADTYCYDALIVALKHHIVKKEFKLLEYLGREIYLLIKQTVSDDTQVSIRLIKNPLIANLTNGVAFYYGDEENNW